MNRIVGQLLVLLYLFQLASVAGAATNEITEPYQGIRLIHSRSTVPRLVDMWIAEIDMSAPGLDFKVTPSNGALPGDTTPQTTRAFATQEGAQLAINANFFSSAGSGQYHTLGLSVSNGDAYSPFQSGFLDALNVSPDNVASIIRATSSSGFGHNPPTTLYNAVGGNTRLVLGGANVANDDPAVHPRTAAGVTADGKLLLFTVDGRNPGHSGGLTFREMADVLIRWGARFAINLDGGGSTTFVMDDPTTEVNDVQVMNVPVGVGNVPGTERANGNNFAVFASPQAKPKDTVFTFADFEQGDAGTFSHAITFSGSNRGFDGSLSSVETVAGEAHDGNWAQRLTIVNDPNSDGAENHPGGAWFARHVSGGGDPANNISRPAVGSVGFWAKTSDPNLSISLVVDDASGQTGDRGLPKEMIADGQWHPYFWDVADAMQWEGWVNGTGVVDTSFTLDSIHIFGPPNSGENLDAVVYLDQVMHIIPGHLPADFNGDGVVDGDDLGIWESSFGENALADANGDGVTDGTDFLIWQRQFGTTLNPLVTAEVVPEPVAIHLLFVALTLVRGGLPGRMSR